jgi:hypothetical protein
MIKIIHQADCKEQACAYDVAAAVRKNGVQRTAAGSCNHWYGRNETLILVK